MPDERRVPDRPLTGLLVDYGGVLTSSLQECMAAWCEEDDIDPAAFQAVMRDWLGAEYASDARTNPAHALERGELAVPDFERELAARLQTRRGDPVPPDGLLSRMFAAFRSESLMVSTVRRVRGSGVRVALVSNSWGMGYPRDGWDELFDAVVISGEVGMRKPEAEIYLHAARELDLHPAECVFVDDLRPNVEGAEAVGMVGVHHRTPEETVRELSVLFGLPASAPGTPE